MPSMPAIMATMVVVSRPNAAWCGTTPRPRDRAPGEPTAHRRIECRDASPLIGSLWAWRSVDAPDDPPRLRHRGVRTRRPAGRGGLLGPLHLRRPRAPRAPPNDPAGH